MAANHQDTNINESKSYILLGKKEQLAPCGLFFDDDSSKIIAETINEIYCKVTDLHQQLGDEQEAQKDSRIQLLKAMFFPVDNKPAKLLALMDILKIAHQASSFLNSEHHKLVTHEDLINVKNIITQCIKSDAVISGLNSRTKDTLIKCLDIADTAITQIQTQDVAIKPAKR